MSANPFQPKPVAPVIPAVAPVAVAPVAPVIPEVVAPVIPPMPEQVAIVEGEAPVAPVKVKKPKGQSVNKDGSPRAVPNKAATAEQRKYIIANYANANRGEIAAATGLTGQQVYRTVYDIRKGALERAEQARAAGDEARAQSIIAWTEATLPKKEFGGGRTAGGGGGKSAVDALLDELLG